LPGPAGGEIVLLGSVHYLRNQDHPLPASVDALYANADRLVMELDLDDIDAQQLQSEFLSAAMLPTGRSLSDVLDRSVYLSAERQARTFGVDLALLGRFEPWLVAITMLDLGMGQLGYQSSLGVEQYFLAKARRDRKEVLGLESLATQIAIFDGMSLSDQQSLLAQTIGELEAASEAMDDMVGAWRAGALDDLTQSLMSEFSDFPGLYDALVAKRNNAWVGEIERLLGQSANTLIVVGALHLVGQDSVIELLRARGHRIESL
jgi:uncharacterized protein YbaP (TraB family)